MTKETHNLELSTRHQLLDLNKDTINFVLNFNIVAEENKHFFVIILTQKDVDKYKNLDDIEMKIAPGKISGSITVKDNVFENYILLLKSNDNCKVNIELEIEEIEPELNEPEINNVQENFDDNMEISENHDDSVQFYKKTWFWILLFIVLLIVGYLAYSHIQHRKENHQLTENISHAANISKDSVNESGGGGDIYENLKNVNYDE
jgi:hypothetical protein